VINNVSEFVDVHDFITGGAWLSQDDILLYVI
jgi:hypothetical protein